MPQSAYAGLVDDWKRRYPEKFVSAQQAFAAIRRGDRIFLGTGCGEPQHLVRELIRYVEAHPKAVTGAELLQLWTLGVAPYADRRFESHFRLNSFFVGNHTRQAVNEGLADYTPIFLSQVPGLFRRGLVPIDVALVQVSPPDRHGYMSLGISVDIVKAACEAASRIIAQVNPRMPRVHGDGILHLEQVDYLVVHEEPLLEYRDSTEDEVADEIGKYVARLVEDGDTIQVGYGSIPNGILRNLRQKRHLGVHTELISDGLVDLMRRGVVDNSQKTINRGITVASFAMGTEETYQYIDDNPFVQFRTIDYTNDPLLIARQDRMVAINSALQVDLTGQATAESIGATFYSGIGGQADFMRGAVLARNGKAILVLPSTAEGGKVSRIVPFLSEGAGATLNRGDLHYVVTEYGIAYLHGKNVRERAMELIAIAHPEFRGELIEAAKERRLIYRDQAFIPGKRGEYPEELETWRTTKTGLEIFLRPVKISDEPIIKDFFYDLSDRTLYRRFISARADMPHEWLQEFVVIDYTREMVILAFVEESGKQKLVGIGQYAIDERSRTAEVAVVVRDEYQRQGIGTELLSYLTYLAKRQGLLGFTAEVLVENRPMLALFEKMGFDIQRRRAEDGVYELKMAFRSDR